LNGQSSFLHNTEKEITNEERKEQQKYAILVAKTGRQDAVIKAARRIIPNTQ
jgi:hypothetical protein